MRVAICDDEKVFRAHLKELLVKDSFAKGADITVSEYACGEDLLKAYTGEPAFCADILFLDIRMQGMDGLETARRLREQNCNCLIIFLTSLAEYARKGYEVKAFRYLLKEEADREIGRVMEECRRELGAEEYFSFTWERCNYSIHKKDILYFESRKRLIYLYTAKRKYQFYQKLDYLEEQLAQSGFLRCHRSFLVQERYVKGWRENVLWLEDGTELPVSRTYEKEVNRKLMLRV